MSKTVNIYKVKEGDTLSEIAKLYHTGVRQLTQIKGNEHLADHINDIHPGDEIIIKPIGDYHAHCYHCEHN